MKTTLPAIFLLLAALITGCGSDKGTKLADIKNATPADSMLFYYARLQAFEYFRAARTDTDLLQEDERELYLEGVRDGIEAMRKGPKNKNYNLGLRRGARMAMRMMELAESYDLDFNEDILLESFTNAILDTADHIREDICQEDMFRILLKVRNERNKKLRRQAEVTLADVAKQAGMTHISPTLYYKIDRAGKEPMARKGDALYLTVNYRTAGGKELVLPATERVLVGTSGVSDVLNSAYQHLNRGATATFATMAEDVFGSRCRVMGVELDDVLLITMTLDKLDIDNKEVRDADALDDESL